MGALETGASAVKELSTCTNEFTHQSPHKMDQEETSEAPDSNAPLQTTFSSLNGSVSGKPRCMLQKKRQIMFMKLATLPIGNCGLTTNVVTIQEQLATSESTHQIV